MNCNGKKENRKLYSTKRLVEKRKKKRLGRKLKISEENKRFVHLSRFFTL
jgi:hypothetical protein